MTNYEALCEYGFSPTKAAEIDLDVKRNDAYSIKIMNLVRSALGVPRMDETKSDPDLTLRLVKLFGDRVKENAL